MWLRIPKFAPSGFAVRMSDGFLPWGSANAATLSTARPGTLRLLRAHGIG
jgi:hypothetical protein